MREITLRLGEHYSGAYGAAPIDLWEDFDAFWGGNGGIHHDVFEHYFEETHPYFRGQYKANVLGEIAASAHMWYFQNILCCNRRNMSGGWMSNEDMIQETFSYLLDNCRGSNNFGDELYCNIPYQRPTNNPGLEDFIKSYLEKFPKLHPDREDMGRYCNDAHYGQAMRYYKTVTPEKIRSAIRWGYRMAEKSCPNTNANRREMDEFIAYWDDWCKEYSAERISHFYDRIQFKVWLKDKTIQWTCRFRDNYDVRWVQFDKLKIPE